MLVSLAKLSVCSGREPTEPAGLLTIKYRCARCGHDFSEEDMAPKRDSNGLRYTYCRHCQSERMSKYYLGNKDRLRQYKSQWRREHPKRYVYQPYDEAASARRKLFHAVHTGKVEKEPCEVCGVGDTRGHHEDYSKPLEVRWLCPLHHVEVHHQAE